MLHFLNGDNSSWGKKVIWPNYNSFLSLCEFTKSICIQFFSTVERRIRAWGTAIYGCRVWKSLKGFCFWCYKLSSQWRKEMTQTKLTSPSMVSHLFFLWFKVNRWFGSWVSHLLGFLGNFLSGIDRKSIFCCAWFSTLVVLGTTWIV